MHTRIMRLEELVKRVNRMKNKRAAGKEVGLHRETIAAIGKIDPANPGTITYNTVKLMSDYFDRLDAEDSTN